MSALLLPADTAALQQQLQPRPLRHRRVHPGAGAMPPVPAAGRDGSPLRAKLWTASQSASLGQLDIPGP